MVSNTVTMEVQVAVFPLLSITVSTTGLAPVLPHPNELGLMPRLEIPQASLLLLSTWSGDKPTVPAPPRKMVIFWQDATGRVESITATEEVQVPVLPLLSVTVRTVLLLPTLTQVKLLLLRLLDAMIQASVLPLSTMVGVMTAFPTLFKYTVMLLQLATGRTVSCTVTWAVQVVLLPLTSSTVKPILFNPKLPQFTEAIDGVRLAIPHASVLPLFRSGPVMVAVPPGFRNTVIVPQIAIGLMVSNTLTSAVQDEVLPLPSVKVKVTGWLPTWAQLNILGDTEADAIPQASVLLLFTKEALMVTLPDASR